MLFIAAWRRGHLAPLLPLLLTIFCIVGSGCSPDAFFPEDEERDRDFQRARDAERLGDFEGAAEFYERALERNPRSAIVHLGYASLCEVSLQRYAYAVYHYQRYLRLRPDDPRADDIRRRVTNCTERLATTVPLVIRSETIARDLEAVRRENQALKVQVATLMSSTAYWSNEVARLTMSGGNAPTGRRDPVTSGGTSSGDTDRTSSARGDYSPRDTHPSTSSGGTSVARTHRIRAGDTLHRISRQYGVSLQALRQANPGLNERRLLPGTVVRIPIR